MHFSCEALRKVWNLSCLSNPCKDAVEKLIRLDAVEELIRLCTTDEQNRSEVIHILPVKFGVKLWKQRRPSRLVE